MYAKNRKARLFLVASLAVTMMATGCEPRIFSFFKDERNNQPAPFPQTSQPQEAAIPPEPNPSDSSANASLALVFEPDGTQKYKWIEYGEWSTGHPIAESAAMILAGTVIVVGYVGIIVLYICAAGAGHGSYSGSSSSQPNSDQALFHR